MVENIISAVHRNVIGKQVKALRREGKLPAVLYGRYISATPVLLDQHDASNILGQISGSALVTIVLEGEKHLALVREKQRNFMTGVLLHIDFQVVSMLDKLRTNVALEFKGEALAVKLFNGILVTEMNSIEVECLPQDLPERILVDLSALKEIGSALYVKDLALPENVEVHEDANAVVVVVRPPEVEEEEEEAAAVAVSLAEPEVIERGKKEEEDF